MGVRIIIGDVREQLPLLAVDSFDCCVTSPPYFGLRDYGVNGQIGLEPTLDGYLSEMVAVCREVRRVLKPSGTFWLNIGDSYAGGGNGGGGSFAKDGIRCALPGSDKNERPYWKKGPRDLSGCKPKDLMMVPARLALALQADGWYVRSEIIWHKPNPMPESVTDRPSCSHEHVWMLSKNERYFYDRHAVAQPLAATSIARLAQNVDEQLGSDRANGGAKTNGRMKAVRFGGDKGMGEHGSAGRRASGREWDGKDTASLKNVWTVPTQPFREAHFATFPPELAERCIKAGCPIGGQVLDPFGGAGTTGLVADRLQRHATLIELNPAYAEMARRRVDQDAPLFAEAAE